MSKRAIAQVLGLAALAMIAGTLFCLLDNDHGSVNLCHSILATGIVLVSGLSLIPTESLLPALIPAYQRHPADRPAPPPRA